MPAEKPVEGPKRGGSQRTACAVITSSAALHGRADMAGGGGSTVPPNVFGSGQTRSSFFMVVKLQKTRDIEQGSAPVIRGVPRAGEL